MPRHMSAEAYQMDLRTSASQQQLNPSRSSSMESGHDELDGAGIEPMNGNLAATGDPNGLYGETSARGSHKVDLYSIPVFCLEVIVLAGLAYFGYYIHFQYRHEPLLSGFYCDDVAYRQQPLDTLITRPFTKLENEMTVVLLTIAVPIVIVVFCELVNSMFGALKFRQISALCTCCKLHSITRRTFRFSGAYLLGFLFVMISCDILATTTGRLKPYFVHECRRAYQACLTSSGSHAPNPSPIPMNSGLVVSSEPTASALTTEPALEITTMKDIAPEPASQPISASPNSGNVNNSTSEIQTIPKSSALTPQSPPFELNSSLQQNSFHRQWIDLNGRVLSDICDIDPFINTEEAHYHLRQLAMSWPSFPASILTYAVLYIAFYLSYVGTARPFRIITCVLVVAILLLLTVFNAKLVEEHFSHWEDVAAGAILALVVVVFILTVYLNKFRDSHYYENQKIFNKRKHFLIGENLKGHNIDTVVGPFHAADKPGNQVDGINFQNGDTNGSVSNNDLAMRYFQIPRANYRGAPRPLSTMNQMR